MLEDFAQNPGQARTFVQTQTHLRVEQVDVPRARGAEAATLEGVQHRAGSSVQPLDRAADHQVAAQTVQAANRAVGSALAVHLLLHPPCLQGGQEGQLPDHVRAGGREGGGVEGVQLELIICIDLIRLVMLGNYYVQIGEAKAGLLLQQPPQVHIQVQLRIITGSPSGKGAQRRRGCRIRIRPCAPGGRRSGRVGLVRHRPWPILQETSLPGIAAGEPGQIEVRGQPQVADQVGSGPEQIDRVDHSLRGDAERQFGHPACVLPGRQCLRLGQPHHRELPDRSIATVFFQLPRAGGYQWG